MVRKHLTIVFFLVLSLSHAEPGYISVAEGLSNRFITCILQDHYGLIWIGTTNGLNVYDGYTFKNYFTYSRDLKLSNSRINGMAEDGEGNLWVATDKGLNKIAFDRSGNDVPASLSSRNICSLSILKDNSLLLGTADGEIIKASPAMNLETVHKENRAVAINGIFIDVLGNTWFFTNSEKRIYKITASSKLDGAFHLTEPISSNFIVDGKSLLTSCKGTSKVQEFDAETGKLNNSNYLASLNANVKFIYKDRHGNIWVACAGGGLVRLNILDNSVDDFSQFFNRTYFGSDIQCVYEDNNGMIWVGTDGGLVKVATSSLPFKSYLSHVDPAGTGDFISTRGMLEDSNGSIYVGSYNGLYEIHPDGKTSRYLQNGSEIAVAFQLVNYDSENILMTSVTKGLLFFNKVSWKFTSATADGANSDNQLYALHKDSRGTIWVGSRNKGLKIFDEKNKSLLPYLDQKQSSVLSQSFVLAITEHPADMIWVGTNKGLLRIDKNSKALKQYTLQSSPALTNEEILCITAGDGRDLWIGSRGGGLMKLDLSQDSLTYFNTTEGLSSNIIYGIIKDGDYLWLSTENGISRFDTRSVQFKNYYDKDGLSNNEFNTASYLKSSDGRIYFGGIDGVNAFYPRELSDKKFPGRIVLTSLKRGSEEFLGQMSTQDKYHVDLPYDDRNLSLQFALTDYYKPQGNSFYYRINGIDNHWVSLGPQNALRLSQLPAGDYELLLRGKNSNDQESTNQLSITLHVEQVFYKQAWFSLLIGTLVVLIIFLFFRMRLNQLLNVQRLRTKIASDLHDEVGSMLTRISILTEVLKYKNKDQDEITQIASASRQATSTMSDVLWSVDARNDKMGNLVDRMREHADAMLTPLKIAVHFESSLNESTPLDMQTRQNVLLIFKEAIHNIAKHSSATAVDIYLRTEHQKLVVTIHDNGKATKNTHVTGQGLKNMSMRAREIGGEIQIENHEGYMIRLIKALT